MAEATHEIALPGCTPTPLAHYLKALGVLRLVSEQVDAGARGWWQDDLFHLRSSLDVDGLMGFFLDDYRPTPLVAPWNGGSGFYPNDRDVGIDAISSSEVDRLSGYAHTITLCRSMLADLGLKKAPKDDEKEALLTVCRSRLPDRAVTWLDAAFVLTNDGPSYPPLLATGGIDNRLEFTNNFMQRVAELIVAETGEATPRSRDLLQGALLDVAAHDLLRKNPRRPRKPIGQFSPGAAGGANAAADFDGDAVTNAWTYVLMLEGALLFSGSVSRRMGTAGTGAASYPFTVKTSGAGWPSIAHGDEVHPTKTQPQPPTHEIWLPLWSRPASLSEIATLLREGRANLGTRQAANGVEFARAVATLGVDRGIASFQRFAFMQRHGKNHMATPMGAWAVPERAWSSVGLLDQLDRNRWITSLQNAAKLKRTPQRIKRVLQRIQSAMMDVCRHDTPPHWQQVLMALGAAEQAMVRSPQTTASSRLSPLPSLSTGWLRACEDDSPEYRLALSLASIRAEEKIGPLRANMVPLSQWGRRPRFNTQRMDEPFVVWGHGDLVANMTATLMRRCMDARRLGLDALPLRGTRPARLDDIGAFIYAEIDEEKLEGLLWGLNAVWLDAEWTGPNVGGVLPAGYSLLKLVHLPHPLVRLPGAEPVEVRYDPEVSRLACAGRMTEAGERAAHRLQVSGLPVAAGGVPETPELSRRIAAALLFPISAQAVERLCDHVLLPQQEEQTV